MFNGEGRFALQGKHSVGRERVAGNIARPFTQFERLGRRIRHYCEAHAVEFHLLAPVAVIAFDYDFLIGFGADEFERPGPDRMRRHFVAAAVGDNTDRAGGDVPQQCGVRFLHVKDHSEIVGHVDAIDKAIRCRFSAANLTSQQGIEGPLHIA